MGIEDKLRRVQEKLEKTPVNKATETERARLKARIAELQEEQQQRQKETGGGYEGYSVKKTGDATVALVGPPSVGKSTLLNTLTNAESEVGAYEFTTLDVVPGIMGYKGASIQLVDVPGLIGGAAQGKGGGRQVLSVIRNSDMVVLMTSPDKPEAFQQMRDELFEAGIRLDVQPPEVKVAKKEKGGLDVSSTVDQTHLAMETIEGVLRDRGYVNASVIFREDLTMDRLFDALSTNRRYMPSLSVLNKADTLSREEREALEERFPDALFISAETGEGRDEFRDRVWEKLGLMRVYMKEPGKDPDMDEPLVVQKGSTVRDVCQTLPGGMEETFKAARIWGDSAAFPEQKVGADHVLVEGDVVEIQTR